MKTKESKPIRMRNRYTLTDFYYTYGHWSPKEIDGIVFLPVVREENKNSKQVHYMRKDSLEKVK